MKISGRKAIYITLILCALYLAGLMVSSLFFVKEDGVRIAAGWVSHARTLKGNDDPDRPYDELLPGQTMDINSASEQQLSLLPGVGEELAEDIVEFRQKQGGFSSTDELMEIDGIGEGKFAAMQDMISIGEANENSGS